MDEDRIRATVRERLRTGALPKDLPPADPEGEPLASPVPAIRTERGTGEPCAACEEPIAAGEPLEACAYPSGRVLRFQGFRYHWNQNVHYVAAAVSGRARRCAHARWHRGCCPV